jgi:hypothetical protein
LLFGRRFAVLQGLVGRLPEFVGRASKRVSEPSN